MFRTCRTCGRARLMGDFARDASRKSGFKGICRDCDNERSRTYFANNREYVLARNNAIREASRKRRICSTCPDYAVTNRHVYCASCGEKAREHQRKLRGRNNWSRGVSTADRGYGSDHQKKRKGWVPVVATGTVKCARCGILIRPDEPWHLGHDDFDRSRYAGPEHARCNTATAGRTAKARRIERRKSRDW